MRTALILLDDAAMPLSCETAANVLRASWPQAVAGRYNLAAQGPSGAAAELLAATVPSVAQLAWLAGGGALEAGDAVCCGTPVQIESGTLEAVASEGFSAEDFVSLAGELSQPFPQLEIESQSADGKLLVRLVGGGNLFSADTRTVAPESLLGRSMLDGYPRGPGSELLTEWMDRSVSLCEEHAGCEARRRQGLESASAIWFWGASAVVPSPDATVAGCLFVPQTAAFRGLGTWLGGQVAERVDASSSARLWLCEATSSTLEETVQQLAAQLDSADQVVLLGTNGGAGAVACALGAPYAGALGVDMGTIQAGFVHGLIRAAA